MDIIKLGIYFEMCGFWNRRMGLSTDALGCKYFSVSVWGQKNPVISVEFLRKVQGENRLKLTQFICTVNAWNASQHGGLDKLSSLDFSFIYRRKGKL